MNERAAKLRRLNEELRGGWSMMSATQREAALQRINVEVGRPADYHYLDEEAQWLIDKKLGLLDA